MVSDRVCLSDEHMSIDLSNMVAEAKRLYEEKNYQEAFAKYLSAAKEGDTASQAFIGQMYLVGKGVQQNDDEALGWYMAAATKNYAPAQCALGHFFQHQKGDTATAIEWYEKAASQGDMLSLWRLGKIYKKGVGVLVDRQKAYTYFEQAAKRGTYLLKES